MYRAEEQKTRRSAGQKEKTLEVPVKFSNQCESELSHTLYTVCRWFNKQKLPQIVTYRVCGQNTA